MKAKQKSKMKRIIAFALCVIMALSTNVLNIFAADEGASDQHGLRGDYYLFSQSDLTIEEYKGTYIDTNINFSDMEGIIKSRTGSANYVAVRWTGYIVAPEDGDYIFHCNSDNGARLYIDNELLIDKWVSDEYNKDWTTEAVTLKAGEAHAIQLDWFEYYGGSKIILSWEKDGVTEVIPESAFYLAKGFEMPAVSAVDDSALQYDKGEANFGGTIKLTGTNMNSVKQVEILSYGGESLDTPVYAEIVNKSASELTLKVPESLGIGLYELKVGTEDTVVGIASSLVSDYYFAIIDSSAKKSGEVDRAEHPRPDWEREDWVNLNGWWDFQFDANEVGEAEAWYDGKHDFDLLINVPYPWESELSGIGAADYRGRAWYQREFTVDSSWLASDKAVFLYFGAVDAKCMVFVNGQYVGEHDGGYTNFELDITSAVNTGSNVVTVVVEDKAVYGNDSYTALIGKQGEEAPCGYTHTSGIWQTVYLESRSKTYLDYVHVNPDVENSAISVDAQIQSDKDKTVTVSFEFSSKIWDEEQGKDVETGSVISGSLPVEINAGENTLTLNAIPIENVKLWDAETPNLYYGTITIKEGDTVLDQVETYFGMREVTTDFYEDNEYEYIYVNGKPVFLSGLLDQGFWEDGIYTAPSEEALKADLLSMKKLGFNMIRKHLKIEDPLQYYWADKLGMYVWQDMPHATDMNATSSDKEATGRVLYESTLEDMLNRDYNHPSVIAVMLFNETWGIDYSKPAASDGMTTEQWVISLYNKTKELNPNLLVEDMSPAKYDHIQPTDLNTFHMYPKTYAETKNIVDAFNYLTYEGSNFNFTNGYTQGTEPWLNSEFGGVSANNGDWDVSWCFKFMTDIQRQYEKLNGFVYTEPYDIEYERNGILTYDRREKLFPYDEVAYGGDMTINHLTQPNYVGVDVDPAKEQCPGTTYTADVVALNWSGDAFKNAVLKWRFDATDVYGNNITTNISGEAAIDYPAYTSERETISFTLPNEKCVGTLTVWIEENGELIAKNFTNVIVTDDTATDEVEYLTETKESVVLRNNSDTCEVTGNDVIDYDYNIPGGFDLDDLESIRIIAEVSSVKGETTTNGITNAASSQTTAGSERPSDLTVWINGVEIDTVYIPDNPRDIRGTLTLAENFNSGASAGNFGYLVNILVPADKVDAVKAAIEKDGEVIVTYGVEKDADNSNGVRVYADTTGRYAVSPTVILNPTDMVAEDSSITPVVGNYTAQATLKDGGVLSVRGGLEKVQLSDGKLTLNGETAEVGSGEHLVAVKLFDDHIQVYVDNNPVPVIDTYDYAAYTSNKVEVTNGSDLVVSPETYKKTATTTTAGISVKKEPEKTEYIKGEELDVTGLVVKVTYSDGSSEEIKDTTKLKVTGYDKTTLGEQVLTVTYKEMTTTFNVTVKEDPVVTELKNYRATKNDADYRVAQVNELNKILEDGCKAIEAATSETAKAKALADAKAAMDAVKTSAQLSDEDGKVDETIETQTPNADSSVNMPDKGVQTGDSLYVLPYLAMLCVAVFGILFFKRRKEGQ